MTKRSDGACPVCSQDKVDGVCPAGARAMAFLVTGRTDPIGRRLEAAGLGTLAEELDNVDIAQLV